MLMPKLKWRFRAVFENLGISTPRSELTKQIVSFARPSLSFEPIDIDVYNSKVRLAGRQSWGDINVEFRDDAHGSVAKLLGEQIQKQFDFMEQASASSGIDYKFTTRLEMLDGGNGAFAPTILETWEIYGCYIADINWNDLNYSDSAPVTISATLRFDNALQTPLSSGVGTNVGRTLGDVITG